MPNVVLPNIQPGDKVMYNGVEYTIEFPVFAYNGIRLRLVGLMKDVDLHKVSASSRVVDLTRKK